MVLIGSEPNLFIAAEILTVGAMGIFAYLRQTTEDWNFKTVWLVGIFLTMSYGFTNIYYGFDNITSNPLDDLAFTVLQILIYGIDAIIFYLILGVMYRGFRSMYDAVTGRKDNREIHEKFEG